LLLFALWLLLLLAVLLLAPTIVPSVNYCFFLKIFLSLSPLAANVAATAVADDLCLLLYDHDTDPHAIAVTRASAVSTAVVAAG